MKMFFIAAAVVSLSAGVAQAQDKTYILNRSDMHVPTDNLMSGPGLQEKIDLGRQLSLIRACRRLERCRATHAITLWRAARTRSARRLE